MQIKVELKCGEEFWLTKREKLDDEYEYGPS